MSKANKKQDSNQEKKREVKVVYYDDNSTIADMSGTRKDKRPPIKTTAREKWQTYLAAVRRMVVPMLCTLGAVTVVFLIMYLLFML